MQPSMQASTLSSSGASLHQSSALALAAMVARRDISAVELLQAFVDRIEGEGRVINAVVALCLDEAFARAKAADNARAAGQSWGPLHGVPMTVKDSFDVAGLPSTFGRPERAGHRAAHDALTVARLRAAGAIVFGKTNVPKDLADWQSANAIHGRTLNPWDQARSPGGSSGGAAAALAAGLTALELGSDIGGSIRIPAHFCGVYGHKPTRGIVPMRGHALEPGDTPGDITVAGPLARSTCDLAVALDILTGEDPEEGGAWRLTLPREDGRDLRSLRIAVMANDATFTADGEIAGAIEGVADFLRREGFAVSNVSEPALGSRAHYELYLSLLRAATSQRLLDEEYDAVRAQAAALKPDDTGYAALIARKLTQSHRDWLKADHARQALRVRWRAFFADHDLLICPPATTVAFEHVSGVPRAEQRFIVDGAPRLATDTYYWLGLAALSYLPATTVPVGLTRAGLPTGMQVIGPEFSDYRCIAFAQFLERGYRGYVPPPGVV